MGESSPPTAADYAHHDASVARESAERTQRTVGDLDIRLRRLIRALVASGALAEVDRQWVMSMLSERVVGEQPPSVRSATRKEALNALMTVLSVPVTVAEQIYTRCGRVIHDAVAADMQQSTISTQGESTP